MRIGIFGGTFDPPHSGHVCLCKAFLERFNIDKLYVIPTFIPPHKEIKSMTQTAQRFEMTEIAFSNISDKIVVSDMEIKRQGKSYTALTIKEFKDQGFDDIYLIEEDIDITKLKLQDEEVQSVKWASLEDIVEMINHNKFVPYHKSLIELLFSMRNKNGAYK